MISSTIEMIKKIAPKTEKFAREIVLNAFKEAVQLGFRRIFWFHSEGENVVDYGFIPHTFGPREAFHVTLL